jgi:hypothetical protein
VSLTPEEVAASIRDKDPGTRPLPKAELPEAEVTRMGRSSTGTTATTLPPPPITRFRRLEGNGASAVEPVPGRTSAIVATRATVDSPRS